VLKTCLFDHNIAKYGINIAAYLQYTATYILKCRTIVAKYSIMKSIAVDMDNVIADVESHYITWYESALGVKISKADMMGKPELSAFDNREAAEQFLYTPGFFRTVPLMPGAQETLQRLNKDYDIYIVSAAMQFPQSLKEKLEWLDEYFPFISWKKIIFCGDKSKINTDLMIDDHLKNLNSFKGKGILFTACHNISLNYPARLNSWSEAERYLHSLK
jgi:5'-nucleotidase